MAANEPPYPKIMHGVPGHLSRREANYLYGVSAILGSGKYAELGTYCGRSTVCIAGGMKDAAVDAHLITVDAYSGLAMTPEVLVPYSQRDPILVKQRFEDKGVGEYITQVIGLTNDVVHDFKHTEFNFLFIDAAHSYAECRTDFENWSPLVKSGGEIAFHDANLDSVNQVVVETGWERRDIDTMAIVRKP